MAFEGTVLNGVVVPDAPQRLPEGARVEIVLMATTNERKTLREALLESAGCMTDLPPDFAAQHDHYIHGTPKR